MVTHLAQQIKLPRKDAEAAVDVVFGAMACSLETGVWVELRGFGSSGLKEGQSRTGHNPKTGVVVPVAARRVMFFKTGKALRERVDSRFVAILRCAAGNRQAAYWCVRAVSLESTA
ncbi:MAG: HU family DNA-binding protein [Magnetococcus sp. YQC-5]